MFARSTLFHLLAAALVAAAVAYSFTVAAQSAQSALNRAANPDARLVGRCDGVLRYHREESDFPMTGCEWIRPVDGR